MGDPISKDEDEAIKSFQNVHAACVRIKRMYQSQMCYGLLAPRFIMI